MSKSKPSFEESLMKQQDVPLEQAIESYKEGLKYYEQCKKILDDASAQIETLTRE